MLQVNNCSACLSEKETVKGLYGSEFDKNRSCGYCLHHRCYLTVKQLRQHDCLKKQCYHLQKNEQHDWWRQRSVMKQKRKERKEILDLKNNFVGGSL
jgi:hypothetical protein